MSKYMIFKEIYVGLDEFLYKYTVRPLKKVTSETSTVNIKAQSKTVTVDLSNSVKVENIYKPKSDIFKPIPDDTDIVNMDEKDREEGITNKDVIKKDVIKMPLTSLIKFFRKVLKKGITKGYNLGYDRALKNIDCAIKGVKNNKTIMEEQMFDEYYNSQETKINYIKDYINEFITTEGISQE